MRLEAEFMRELLWSGSRELAIAIQPLNEIQRQGIRALYTFFRVSRDTIDKAESKNAAQIAVSHLTRLFESANVEEAVNEIPDLGLAWEAWLGLEEEFEVPRAYALEFAIGLRSEADGYRPQTVEDLLRYCYRTGGVLGLIVCHILQVPEVAVQSFVDAGSAARLTSLANNVYRDFTLGRISAPVEWFSRTTTSTFSKTWAGEAANRFQKLAGVLYKSSREAFRMLPFSVRVAFATALVLHREGRSSFVKKIDRVIDETLRQAAAALWSTSRENFRRFFGLGPGRVTLTRILPGRDSTIALRNQTFRFARDLDREV